MAEEYADDLADVVVPAAEAMGYRLLDWQMGQIRDWSAVGPDGKWVHTRCGASIPRQAGKSIDGIVWAAVLSCLMGYKVLWTDHNYSTTCEMLERFRDIFGARVGDTARGVRSFNRRVKAVNSKTAQEWFKFKGGGVLAFSTRTKSAALGFSFDVIVYDEAQELTGEHVQAITPTLSSGAKANPQALYLGTPTRAGSHAEVFQNVREDALAGGEAASGLCWLEYGVEEVGDVADESRWYGVNPSLGHHANIEAIRIGLHDNDDLAFAQEYLGYWLPKVADAVISPEEWRDCLVGKKEALKEGREFFGVKFSPDGSTVALAAARRSRGDPARPVHVELLACEPTSKGTGWLAEWLAARSREASCAVVDGQAGAGALCDRLAAARVPRRYVVRPKAADVCTAAATMLEAVRSKQVTHIEGPALDASATRSSRRKIGSSGGWGWGGEDSAPMEAASLALWAARTCKRDPGRVQEASF